MSRSRTVKGGVCSAKGFRAAGVAAEIKYKGRNDVALVVADEPCVAAAVFTTNKVAAAPVLYDREIVKGGKVQAILANSGCANACTGEQGLKDAKLSALVTAGELGIDPKTMLPVSARVGPYGAYVQLGPLPVAAPPPEAPSEDGKKKKKKKKDDTPKPKRVSLPKGMDPNLINLDQALQLLSLPREVGPHPETKVMISAGIGRFGPYLKMGPQYKTLAEGDDVLSIGLNRAVVLLAEPSKGRFGGGANAGKLLGEHPEDKKPVTLNKGRFGPYVKWGKVMATVTKAYDPENLTLTQALEIIEAKIARGPSKGFGGKGKKAPKEKNEKEAPAPTKKPKKKSAKK